MRKTLAVVFCIYIFVVLRLTVLRDTVLSDYSYNLSLFSDLISIYKNGTTWQFLRLFLGNILWFVPFGFLAPLIFEKLTFLKTALLGFAFSLAIESMQLVFKMGVFEIDDLILNTFGAILGYFVFSVFRKIIKINKI